MPRSGSRDGSTPRSGASGRVRVPLEARSDKGALERAALLHSELRARVRLDYGELPAPTSRTRAELVTHLGEPVTHLGEPVWVLVAA